MMTFAESLPFFYVGYLICCMGVNGSNTHAVKAMAGALAVKDGYGRGEYCELQHKYQLLNIAFYWKYRDNVELPLTNDDFLLKNGRLFCNSRYSGWVQNLRALSTSGATVAYAAWYSYCSDNGIWTGSVWWLCGSLRVQSTLSRSTINRSCQPPRSRCPNGQMSRSTKSTIESTINRPTINRSTIDLVDPPRARYQIKEAPLNENLPQTELE